MQAPLAVSGRGAISHTWMDESEPRLVVRRLDFVTLDEARAAAVYLRDVTDPAGGRTRWLVVEHQGRVVFESADFDLELEGRAQGAPSGYPLPAAARLRAPGLVGTVTLARTLVEHDPLGDLPQPFRFLLSFAMRPRRVWTDSPFSLRLDAAPGRTPLELEGNGITSVTYLNPLASPAPGSSNPTPGAF
jgi:hypothetical protein